MSRFDEEQFVSFVSGVLNSLCITRKCRKARRILIDSSAITLDLNWFKRTISKAQLTIKILIRDTRRYKVTISGIN
jgi:hypothetical protein